MKLLVTNDDGIAAEGLRALMSAARKLGDAVAVAPLVECSEVGHAVTTKLALRANRCGDDQFAVNGTPADCVRLALLNIMPTADLILAGINHGGNLGADVYYSGTVAAAREATLHGRRAIAFSYLRHHDRSLDWNRAELWVSKVIFELSGLPWEPGSFYNVNFPNLSAGASDPKLVYCDIDINPLPLVFHSKEEGLLYTGDYYSRARTANLDVDNCFRGAITISVIRLGAPA